jgi:hypothetical protein
MVLSYDLTQEEFPVSILPYFSTQPVALGEKFANINTPAGQNASNTCQAAKFCSW